MGSWLKRKQLWIAVCGVLSLVGIGAYVVYSLSAPPTLARLLGENGFVEVRPATRLLQPGSWVCVLHEDPLHLSIICTNLTAIGSEKQRPNAVRDSESMESSVRARFEGRFKLGEEMLKGLEADSKLSGVTDVTFHLKNVRILELADDAALEAIKKNRQRQCSDAILFRRRHDSKITMIKAVLIADVEYKVEFKPEVDASTKARVENDLALKLDMRVHGTGSETRSIVGKDLIWGVRTDDQLAMFGLDLAPTGAVGEPPLPDVDGSILNGKGVVESIDGGEPCRRDFESTVVKYDVPVVRQTSGMSCWAAVYAMLLSWHENREEVGISSSDDVVRIVESPASAIAKLGQEWEDVYVRDVGLSNERTKDFIQASGMKSLPPANYIVEKYVEMLKAHGPLWIVMGDGFSSHARVLIGVYGDISQGGLSKYENSVFEFIDPSVGDYEYKTGLEFVKDFEKEAAHIVNIKADDLTLRDQILYWPD